VNRLLKPLIFLLASIYFVVDAVFLTMAKPVADWLADRKIFEGLRGWIISLRPYPTLALFAVPILILEPVKPAAAYLAATGHVAVGVGIFVVGEILKLVLIERLFAVSRNKLMSIAVFAWAYGQYRQIMDWIEATEAWQAVRRWSKIAQYAVRIYLLEIKNSHRPAPVSFQSR
jgi:thiol:disulfide interchange protein